MISKEDIKKILEVAVNAPSGDNSQPWRFEVKENTLNIYSLPERDNPRFNFRDRGTILAHGALIENIVLASKKNGYDAQVFPFPDPDNKRNTSKIVFTPSSANNDPLFDVIKARQTNRKFYKNRPLSPEHKEALLQNSQNLILIEDRNQIELLGRAVSVNEIVMLEDKYVHDLFYSDIRWTTKSERKLKHGLYLKTMELPLPKLFFFKILQWWPAARILNRLGMAKFIAKDNSKLYSSASAIAILPVQDKDEAFFEAGRLTQKFWLTGTLLGLSMHPVTGVIYLSQRINANEANDFEPDHVKIVRESYKTIEKIAKVPGPYAMLLRIGYSTPPSGIQSRLQPEIKYK